MRRARSCGSGAGRRVALLGEGPRGKTPLGTHHAFATGPNVGDVADLSFYD